MLFYSNNTFNNHKESNAMDMKELQQYVITGKRDDVVTFVNKYIESGEDPNKLVDEGMIPAMSEIGDRFSRNEAYVPELLIAARAMQAGLEILEPLLAETGREAKGKVAIGTVKGDLHDIGKNLVAIMLKGAGYEVMDLGVNCDAAKFKEAVDNGAKVVACSALLTTTMGYMKEVVDALKSSDVKIVIGGAPVTQTYAEEIGADGYSNDANQAVKVIDTLYEATAS